MITKPKISILIIVQTAKSIKDKTNKIKFNDDKSSITITPALTSTDSSKSWYKS